MISLNKIYAFTDEYGAFGWDFKKNGVSTHFIITAIIVKDQDVQLLRNEMEKVRLKHFQTGEIKSSKIGAKHHRRLKILNDIKELPFSIFPVVIDKRDCQRMPGLRFKPSFYKFMNNILHKELRKAFPNLTIVADEIGGSDYMMSFVKYVKDHQELPDLFGNTEFGFEASNKDVIIQLADLISGTLSYSYDVSKKDNSAPNYLKILENKIIRVMIYPQKFETYIINNCAIAEDYDEHIATLCFNQAVLFLTKNKNTDDDDIKAQMVVLDYLLFRFMNNDTRGYIPTKELKKQLSYMDYNDISTSTFRLKIICKLRDHGVIIASSPKGYKIPSKESELYDFVNHGASIVIPMLERLKKCRDLVKLSTANELDLFAHDEYTALRRYFDYNPPQ